MAQRRMLNKSISLSKQVNKMGMEAAFIFTWLIPHVDDFGRMDGDVDVIKAMAFPMMHEITMESIAKAIEKAQEFDKKTTDIPLIYLYEVGGKKYIYFPKWDIHQTGLRNRTKSRYPEYIPDSDNLSEIIINYQPTELNGTERNGTEGNENSPDGDALESSDGSGESEHLLRRDNLVTAWREKILITGGNIRTHEWAKVLPLIKQIRDHPNYRDDTSKRQIIAWIETWLEQRKSTKTPAFAFFLEDILRDLDTEVAQ